MILVTARSMPLAERAKMVFVDGSPVNASKGCTSKQENTVCHLLKDQKKITVALRRREIGHRLKL